MVQERGIDNPNFLNFPPVVLDDLAIGAQWLLLEREFFLSEYAKLMPSVYCRLQKENQVDTIRPTASEIF